jgi:nucleotidyltransferase/DNA polymerase involved in DNA repair
VSCSFLHVDVDEFVAAVEVLRRPELRGRPVVVGGRGDPTKRGVVSTASYEARRFGVRSGMPLRRAVRKCPDAVFLPVDRDAYEAASKNVMQVLARFTNALEVWGWDEAFLDVAGNAEAVARRIQAAVSSETGLSCSIGVGDNKLRAKHASRFAKPAGIYRLSADEWFGVMGERGPEQLWGVGQKSARRLAELGIERVRDLAGANEESLARHFGPGTGPRLIALARGEDSSPINSAPRRAKSRSFELTFDEDVEDPDVIRAEVRRMAQELAEHATASERLVSGVTVKVRFTPFTTRSRGMRLSTPSGEAKAIVEAASGALGRFELDRPVRLVGVKTEFE